MSKKMEIELDGRLLERLTSVCEYLRITPQELIGYAVEQEITRQEIHMLKDEITIQEIDRNVLKSGQSLTFHLVDENTELNRQVTTCQMCLQAFGRVLDRVEGPLFCDECLALAKGGDFSGLKPQS